MSQLNFICKCKINYWFSFVFAVHRSFEIARKKCFLFSFDLRQQRSRSCLQKIIACLVQTAAHLIRQYFDDTARYLSALMKLVYLAIYKYFINELLSSYKGSSWNSVLPQNAQQRSYWSTYWKPSLLNKSTSVSPNEQENERTNEKKELKRNICKVNFSKPSFRDAIRYSPDQIPQLVTQFITITKRVPFVRNNSRPPATVSRTKCKFIGPLCRGIVHRINFRVLNLLPRTRAFAHGKLWVLIVTRIITLTHLPRFGKMLGERKISTGSGRSAHHSFSQCQNVRLPCVAKNRE